MLLSARSAFALVCLALSLPLAAQTVTIDTTPAHALNQVIPNQALGGGIDRLSIDAIDKTLTKEVLDQTAPSGWGPITYRQNTELSVEAWHWNPEGTWSDPRGQGYFTGAATSSQPIRYSYGFALPRRGFTRNDGTGNTGYSVLTDGDPETFWKSNPYLSQRFTNEDDSLHPQWIILDLKHHELVDTLRIAWAAPYATQYEIQYWTGADPLGEPTHGVWATLPAGAVTTGKGGTETIRFSQEAVSIQFLRIRMTASSNTCTADGPSDPRNCVGYAIREVYLGSTDAQGRFHDILRHTADQDQTTTYCSSVDPWHQPTDLKNKHQAQIGFDLFYTSGATHNLPAMIPIALIYGQPEDAVAEIKYIESHHYPISYVEMGEESDGQYMTPEDYAALYVQFARALHAYNPALKLGGPAFQGVNEDILTWPDGSGRASWVERFLAYLKQHNQLSDLAFFSFEHYPLDACKFSWTGLYDEPQLVTHIMQVWRNDGVPANVPLFITESNLSSGASEAYYDNFAALWLADYIGSFLNAHGDGVYFFHYLPLHSYLGCNNSPGNFGMFLTDKDYKIQQPLAQFFSSQLINTQWLQPGSETNTIYPAAANIPDGAGHQLLTVYAAQRPDKQWSVMLVNRSQDEPLKIDLHFDSGAAHSAFTGTIHSYTFGKGQYQWHPLPVDPMSHPETMEEEVIHAAEGHASPNGPIKEETLTATPQTTYTIPAASIVVLRGQITSTN